MNGLETHFTFTLLLINAVLGKKNVPEKDDFGICNVLSIK